jgi:hypothetical protein
MSEDSSTDLSKTGTGRIFYFNDKYQTKKGRIKVVFWIILSIMTGLFIGNLN